jgi:NUDIX domain
MAAKIVVAVITRDDTVLLVRRRRPEGNLIWVSPGGAVEPRDTEVQAVEREVREEVVSRYARRPSLDSASTPTPADSSPIGSASRCLAMALSQTLKNWTCSRGSPHPRLLP